MKSKVTNDAQARTQRYQQALEFLNTTEPFTFDTFRKTIQLAGIEIEDDEIVAQWQQSEKTTGHPASLADIYREVLERGIEAFSSIAQMHEPKPDADDRKLMDELQNCITRRTSTFSDVELSDQDQEVFQKIEDRQKLVFVDPLLDVVELHTRGELPDWRLSRRSIQIIAGFGDRALPLLHTEIWGPRAKAAGQVLEEMASPASLLPLLEASAKKPENLVSAILLCGRLGDPVGTHFLRVVREMNRPLSWPASWFKRAEQQRREFYTSVVSMAEAQKKAHLP